MRFRNAKPSEANTLTQLTLASKAHWGYPDEWMTLWTDDLTITSNYIAENMVVVAEGEAGILGYVSVKNDDGKFYLDNLFIHPSCIRKGIGQKLLAISHNRCKENGVTQLHVYSDPFSRGFYEKTGAVFVEEVASKVILGRTLPFFTYYIQ